ncbi:HAD hydrolase-like protein [Candidatus Gottesmanbacteria bacterium]|nr:HAD hydrolase-like protein [Candidatus Gottesmanbacteria bacterium]
MVKLIVFDWDDVITLGAKQAYFASYHKALVDVGVHLSPEEERKRILAKWSKPYREELKELLKEHPELVDEACRIYEQEKDKIFLESLKILPGTNELLQSLSKRYILAVSTGNTLEMIKNRIMPRFKIPFVFSQLVSSHEISDPDKMKPHPYMLDVIMRKQNATSDETIYVGDALTDVQMGLNAGVTPVVVLTGHLSKEEAERLQIKWIIPDITHLPKVLVH